MYDLSKHPFFEKWVDPVSGVKSFILKERVAPVQMSFYFVNSSISPDGEYLWFYVGFPPCQERFLAYVRLNPKKTEIKFFPQGLFWGESPMISPDSSGVYYMSHKNLCFINPAGETKIIGSIPEDYIANRYLFRSATHLTLSCDGEWFLTDGQVGDVCFIALIHAKTGDFKLLHEFPYFHDHSAFSPINPKQFICPRDWRRNAYTGKYEWMESRLWVMDIDQTYYRSLCPDLWEGHGVNTAHEWWSKDGKICFVDYENGIFEVDPDTLERNHIWKRPICHAHCNSNRTLFCGDQTPYFWNNDQALELLFFNKNTGKEKHIVSAMPPPPMPRSPYHLDPHPHFSPDDSMIIYMTTVCGEIDVAVTPVEQLIC